MKGKLIKNKIYKSVFLILSVLLNENISLGFPTDIGISIDS